MEASDFEIKVDADNRRYVVKVNKQITIQGEQMKMKEMEVECMKLVEKSVPLLALRSIWANEIRNHVHCFNIQKSTFTDDEEEWYENRAMGKNTNGNFMSVL